VKKRIILVGKAASGKDYLRRVFLENGYSNAVSYTTRPARIGEREGVDYRFISEELAQDYINDDIFLEYVSFNGWIYGTTKEQWDTEKVFIMTPGEINQIDKSIRKGLFIVYLDIDRDIREKRISGRNDMNDSIKRRLDADEIDFSGFKDYDLKITDPEFDVDSILSLMI
jgi:guanylate kinase